MGDLGNERRRTPWSCACMAEIAALSKRFTRNHWSSRDRLDPPLMIVAAVAENGVIGDDNRLLWRLKTDLRRFRDLTWGKPMIMGRKTFKSIGRPLPGRETVVLTRDPGFSAAGVHVAHTWPEAVAAATARLRHGRGRDRGRRRRGDLCSGLAAGGQNLPHGGHASPEGDAIFPPFDRSAFREVGGDHPRRPDDEHPFTFVDLERRRALPLTKARHNPQLAALTGGRQHPQPPHIAAVRGRLTGKSDLCLGVTKAAAEAPGGSAADRAAARAPGVRRPAGQAAPRPISRKSCAAARIA